MPLEFDHMTYNKYSLKRFYHVRTQVFFLFLLFPVSLVGQVDTVELRGYLIDESTGRKLTDVLVVNKSNGEFAYGDDDGNYSIRATKKDDVVFSALGYSSVTISLKDSTSRKAVYFVVPKLNRYSIIIREVSIQAERKVQEIKLELDDVSRSYILYEQQEETAKKQFVNPITALYKRWSDREERLRKLERLKYLDRKRILLKELIRKSKLSETEVLSVEELNSFIEHLLVSDHLLLFPTQYELLAFINIECKKWTEMMLNTEE